MKTFKFVVTIEVTNNWIKDGFGTDMKALEKQVERLLNNGLLEYAYTHEKKITVKCTKNPISKKS